MKYRILRYVMPSDLENEVEKLLKTGWKLVGGLCYDSYLHEYTQAMVWEN